jgi:NTP pyrophosphatase (non-canonical NTP hydrolase)
MNVFKRAVLVWGKDAQLSMLQEECGELVAAINQFRRNRISTAELAEEVADVKILIQQMDEVLPIDELQNAYGRKIDKLCNHLTSQGG